MKLPKLTAPRYGLVKRAVKSVLLELGNPEPPIRLESYLDIRKWSVTYDELEGPDGYMVKLTKGKKVRFTIFIATDPNFPCNEITIRRWQNFTIAHELGHILLHGQLLLNSESDMAKIDANTAKVMEAEANRFASHLLMPIYAFRKISDLLPNTIIERCDVNATPANIRLKGLTPNIRNSLIQSVMLDTWPPIEDYQILPEPPKEMHHESWAAYEQVAATVQQVIDPPVNDLSILEVKNPSKRILEMREKNNKEYARLSRIYGFD